MALLLPSNIISGQWIPEFPWEKIPSTETVALLSGRNLSSGWVPFEYLWTKKGYCPLTAPFLATLLRLLLQSFKRWYCSALKSLGGHTLATLQSGRPMSETVIDACCTSPVLFLPLFTWWMIESVSRKWLLYHDHQLQLNYHHQN